MWGKVSPSHEGCASCPWLPSEIDLDSAPTIQSSSSYQMMKYMDSFKKLIRVAVVMDTDEEIVVH